MAAVSKPKTLPGILLPLVTSPEAAVRNAVLLVLAAGMLAPSSAFWSLLFYLSAVPAVLWRLWRGWRPDWRNPALIAMLALWFWSSLAICWDKNISGLGNSHSYWLRNAFCTLVFLLGFLMAHEGERMRRRILATLIISAAANATISLILFAVQGNYDVRLGSWGVTKNPTLGAAIISLCLLLAMAQAAKKQRWAYAVMPVMVLYLAFSYGRAALLGLTLALAILGLGASPVIMLAGCAVAAGAAGLIWRFLPGVRDIIWQNLAGRGTDCHGFIWRTAWQQIKQQPLIGYGPSARLPIAAEGYCPAFPGPHNLYLSVLYYTGFIGLGLFLLLLALLWRHLHHAVPPGRRRFWVALACIPAVTGISDLSQLIKGPSPTWYIFWLPVLLVLTLPARKPAADTAAFR